MERADIEAARDRIAGHVRSTPVLETGAGSFGLETPLVLKLELLQHTGSFKPRGAFNKMLASDVPRGGRRRGVRRELRAGGGLRRARARSSRRDLRPRHVARRQDRPASASWARTSRSSPGTTTRRRWPRVARQAETGALAMHPFDQPEVVAGGGTVGLELAEQVPDADTVLVAVGGGGLIAGIASWFRGDVRVVGVEPEACPTLHAALAAGEPVDVEVGGIAADSLGPRRVGADRVRRCARMGRPGRPGARRGDPRRTAQVVARRPRGRRAGGRRVARGADRRRLPSGAGRAGRGRGVRREHRSRRR